MDAFDHTDTATETDAAIEQQPNADLIALWTALEADRRARDERTARLRAMRLIGGYDEAV
ncbi:hypothetical protein [Methylobacterium pseudosasicola]|uniref:Uncharacterized protein n=1 Tax=Methylobacterium pseudosasicola TaxID=582667 RepID=A0A1I4IYK1_9HYPH|nr:hypothetical protein [Methylobacterium pseudosasicola]SFL59429.1 hypothetical protein SAMN05192568_100739 [Methylobacterium pseudosasicola]